MSDNNIEHCLANGPMSAIGNEYRSRRLSVSEAVRWYLARIEAFNRVGPVLKAVRTPNPRALDDAAELDDELARGVDRGPLHGIPVLFKDNILAAGMKASAGAAALADFVPRRDATLVRRLREAGAVVLGKTNMTEFADYVSDVMPSGFSAAGGVVCNPHGIDYGRGQGSSVGSAAAVAAAFAPIAIGSETQNSIQTPACYSSVVGYKPSVGTVSRTGVVPLVPSQDSPGPLARTVDDAALVAAAIAGADLKDTLTLIRPLWRCEFERLDTLTGVCIGVPRRTIADRADLSAVLPLFENVLSRLSRAGARIVDPCELPSAEQLQDVRSCVFRTEFKAALNDFLEAHDRPCEIGSLEALIAWNERRPEAIPYGQTLLIAANATAGLRDPAYRADRARDIALSRMAGIDAALEMAGADVLIAPMGSAAKCTGKAGAPVVALPAGVASTGTPFGVTLFASLGSDLKLLRIASAVERIIDGRRTPKL
ncbi:MAG: amidase family protein [Xanthobacteraceae bacterium]